MNELSVEIIRNETAFLVQTQDGGPRVHFLETLVYRTGRMVYSRRTSYTTLLDDPYRETRLGFLVQEQHRAVLEDIASGRLDVHLFKP